MVPSVQTKWPYVGRLDVNKINEEMGNLESRFTKLEVDEVSFE